MFSRINLFLWRHFELISVLLFKRFFWLAQLWCTFLWCRDHIFLLVFHITNILTSVCKAVAFYLSRYILEHKCRNLDQFFRYICYSILDSRIHTLCEILDIFLLCTTHYRSNPFFCTINICLNIWPKKLKDN